MAPPKKPTPAAKPAAPASETVLLCAVEPVRADGADYAPGEVFELDAPSAQALIASGAASAELPDAPAA